MPTVFVVNGKNCARSALVETVRDLGFHALPMADADIALAVLNAIRADLLLIDLGHPEVGGVRLIEEVRRNDQLRYMPILAVGARSGDTECSRLKRHVGVGEILEETECSRDELIEEISKYVAKPGSSYATDAAYEWTN